MDFADSDSFRQPKHFFALGLDVGQNIPVIDEDEGTIKPAKGRVHNGAVLSGVDRLAGEHCVPFGLNLGDRRKFEKQIARLIVDRGF